MDLINIAITWLEEQNSTAGMLLALIIYLSVFPILFVKNEYIRGLTILSAVYKKLLLTGIYRSKISNYYKGIFLFRHDLLDDGIVDYKPTENFEDLYIKPRFTLTNRWQSLSNSKYVSVENLLNTLENDIHLRQLVFIEGKAGYGKTNFLLFLGNIIAGGKSTFRSSVFFEAREIEKYLQTSDGDLPKHEAYLKYSGSKICSLTHFCLRKRGVVASLCEIEHITRNKCLMLIDGFDEIKNSELYEGIVEILRTFKDEKPNVTIILTGRPGLFSLVIGDSFHPDLHYRIGSLEQRGIEDLIKNTFKRTYKPDTYITEYDEFRRRLMSNSALHSLARIPFLLTLMIRLRFENKELPENRDSLIREFIELAVDRKLPSRENGFQSALINVLAKISYDLTNGSFDTNNLETFIKDEIRFFKDTQLTDPRFIIDHLRGSGLLVHHAQSFSFVHKSIQDYLCAKLVYDDVKKNIANISNHKFIFHKSNIDIIFFYCCMIEDATPVFYIFQRMLDFSSCLEILVWAGLRKDIYVKEDAIAKFWDLLEEQKDPSFVAKSTLHLMLSRLKFGEVFADRPVTKAEYEYLAGPVPLRNIESGYVVGLTQEKILKFFDELNEAFLEDEGEYSPVSAHYRLANLTYDTVVRSGNILTVARPDDPRFQEVKKTLKNEIVSYVNRAIGCLQRGVGIQQSVSFRQLLCEDLLASFHPDFLLRNGPDTHDISTERHYLNLRELLFGMDMSTRDHLVRSSKLNCQLLTDRNLTEAERQNIDTFLDSNLITGEEPSLDLDLILIALMYGMIRTLYMSDTSLKYTYSKFFFVKYLACRIAENSDWGLWGSIRIQYSTSKNRSAPLPFQG